MVKIVLLESRAVIRIAGPDARSFLDGLLTQVLPAPGAAAFAALLTPQGKILFDFLVVATDDAFLLDVSAGAADALVKRLSLYRLRAKATIERLGDWAISASTEGDDSNAEGVLSFPDPRLGSLGRRLIGPATAIEKFAKTDEAHYDAHRLALGVPEFGRDFDSNEVFLLDVNYDVLNAVSYTKGCFVGQEVTSRMKRKGEIRKRTLQLSFDGAPPSKGTEIKASDSSIGEALSGREGAGLGLVRLDRLAAANEDCAAIKAAGQPMRIAVPAYLERG